MRLLLLSILVLSLTVQGCIQEQEKVSSPIPISGILFEENFDDPIVGWESIGDWKQENGAYRQDNDSVNAVALLEHEGWQEYSLEGSLRLTGGNYNGGLIFYAKDQNNYYLLSIRSSSFPYSEKSIVLYKKVDGITSTIAETDFSIEDDKDYRFKIIRNGSSILVWFEGEKNPVLLVDDKTYTEGTIGVTTLMSKASFDDLKVTKVNMSFSFAERDLYKKLWNVKEDEIGRVYRFTFPKSGKVIIRGDVRMGTKVSSDDNVQLKVVTGERQLWPKSGTVKLEASDTKGYALELSLDALQDDQVEFIIASENKSILEKVKWEPKVYYADQIRERGVHFIHPNHAIGDVHPYFHNGEIYMFYLKPGGNYEASLIKGTNLIDFKEYDIKHEPNTERPPVRPWYVLGIFYDERDRLFKSYYGTDGNVMRGSVSDDLIRWRSAEMDTLIPAQTGYSVQRDPYVVWNESDQQYWAVMTCRKGGDQSGPNGGICYATSKDLKTWEGKGDLYYPGNMGDPEVPQLLKFGEYWYLLFSPYNLRVGETRYLVSKEASGPWQTFIPDRLDGSDLAAAQIVEKEGGLLLYGWIPLQDQETLGYQYWGGHLGLPRQVIQFSNGSLGTRLEPGVSEMIRGGKWYQSENAITLSSSGPKKLRTFLPGEYSRIDLSLTISPNRTADEVGLILRNPNGNGTVETEVVFNYKRNKLQIRTGNVVHSELGIPWSNVGNSIRVIVEEDMVECFVDNKYSLAARISQQIHRAEIDVYSRNGTVVIPKVEIYRLKSMDEL